MSALLEQQSTGTCESTTRVLLLGFAKDRDDRMRYLRLTDALVLCANATSCKRATFLIPDLAGRQAVKVKGQCLKRAPVC